MGKGSESWDDSALVDAFDRAMATYKAMHVKSSRATSSEEEKQQGDTDGIKASPSEGEKQKSDINGKEPLCTKITKEHIDQDDNENSLPNDATEKSLPYCEDRAAAEQCALQETDLDKDLHVSESQTYSSGFIDTDGYYPDSSNQQNVEYNELLRQYYEIEEQRQKVLQQLQQAGYWNDQTPGQSSTYQQQQQLPAHSASISGPQFSCAPCSRCCSIPLIPTCCSMNGQSCGGSDYLPLATSCSDQCPNNSSICSTGVPCMRLPTKDPTNDDDGVVKAGMVVAEGREKEDGKEESTNIHGSQSYQGTSLDGDLTSVLNAWYAAGFHTGRYLMQQSTKSSQQ